MTKIISLQSENVKRLVSVYIEPKGACTTICGRNGAGKSSVLDSIAMALGGKEAIPPMPVHAGKERAQIVAKLSNGLVVTRTFTAAGGTALKVTNAEGAAFSSPQAMLDQLTGSLSFDPLAFIRLDSKKQAETLRQLTGLDFSSQDKEREKLYADRTLVNRRLAEMRAAVAGLKEYPDVPAAEVASGTILAEIEKAQAHNAGKTRLDSVVSVAAANVQRAVETLKTTTVSIAALEKQLAALKGQFAAQTKSVTDSQALLTAAQQEAAGFALMDTTALKAQLAACEDTNRKVRANAQWAKAIAEGQAKKHESEVLTRKIEAIDKAKADALAAAEMPVAGLGLDDAGVTFEGIPLVQCSSALQQRISVAIGAALNPTLRVMMIKDGSLLDMDSLEALRVSAEELDLQVFIERVGTGEECSVIIEDGMVQSAVPVIVAEDTPAKPARTKRVPKSAPATAATSLTDGSSDTPPGAAF